MSDWTETAADLCRAICSPDLADCEVTLLDADADASAARILPANVCGFTSTLLPLVCRAPQVPKRMATGREFASVIAPSRLWPTPLRPDVLRFVTICAALHELAHHVETLAFLRHVERSFGYSPVVDSVLSHDALVECLSATMPAPLAPWFAHEAGFIRAAIHVSHRAQLHGFINGTPTNLTIAGNRYGLSPVGRYCEALGDEPQRRQEEPIAEILLTNSPIEFDALFTSDTQQIAKPPRQRACPSSGRRGGEQNRERKNA